MSLNQDVLDDLANTTGQSPEDLKNAGPDQASVVGEPTTVLASSDVPQSQQTPITDEIRSKLLNPETQVATIRDGVETTESLGELHKEIADNATISAADAANISLHLEGFSKVFHPTPLPRKERS